MQRKPSKKQIKYGLNKTGRQKSVAHIDGINYKPLEESKESGTSGVVRKFISDSRSQSIAVKAPAKHISKRTIVDPKQYCLETDASEIAKQKRWLNREEFFLKKAYPDKTCDLLHLKYRIENKHYYSWRLIMDVATGVPLNEALKTPKEKSDIINLFLAIAHELKRIHDDGIIHGDIKAQNIMVGEDNQVQFVDFGDAYLTGEEHAVTYSAPCAYIAPERISESQGYTVAPNPNQDVYSLATTFIWSVNKWLTTLDIQPSQAKKQFPKSFGFFNQCRNQDPSVRPSLDEIITTLKDEQEKPSLFGGCTIS